MEKDEVGKRINLTRSANASDELAKLPDGIFGCVSYPNDGGGMAIRGKMPDKMTRDEVLRACEICAHGMPHFRYFANGKFMLTYNYN